jgi:hypothetical protein
MGKKGLKRPMDSHRKEKQGKESGDWSQVLHSASGAGDRYKPVLEGRNKIKDTTREDVKPTPYTSHVGPQKFVSEKDRNFEDVLRTSYIGFVHEPAREVSQAIHKNFLSAFEELERSEYFQFDVVQAGGTQLSKTFVTRTLIGEPGITYNYGPPPPPLWCLTPLLDQVLRITAICASLVWA